MKNSSFNQIVFVGLLFGVKPVIAQLPDSLFPDTNYYPIWNKNSKDLSNWQAHSSNWKTQYIGTDSASIYTDGLAHPGTMTHLFYKYRATGNIEVHFVFRMPTKGGANGGFQFRSRCQSPTGTLANNCGGSPWIACGPQMDLGATYAGDIYNGCVGAYLNNGTVSVPPRIVNNTPTCRAGLNISNWNDYRFRVKNDTAWTYLNNVLCSKFYLTAATDQAATTQGLLTLQYETLMKLEWKLIELKNLDKIPVSLKPLVQSTHFPAIEAGKASLNFSVPSKGEYSVEISDINGSVMHFTQGLGPVSRQKILLPFSGIFFVKIKTATSAFTHKLVTF